MLHLFGRCVMLVDASISIVQTIYLKLTESDANVLSVAQKVQELLDTNEEIILTDSKGFEIHDGHGTQGEM